MRLAKANIHEWEVHKFTAFASDLGMRNWPQIIRFDEKVGNGNRFYRVSANCDSALYRQEFGCVSLEIFNE